MSKKIFVCSRFPNLVNELQKAINNVEFYDACSIRSEIPFSEATIPEEHVEQLINSEIILVDFNLIAPFLNKLKKTKWIQGTWAGIDFLLPHINLSNLLPFKVTRFSGGTLSKQLLDYALANIINYERRFLDLYFSQKQKSIKGYGSYIIPTRTVSELVVGVLGIGAIGGEIASAFKGLGAKVLAYGRSNRSSGEFDEYYTKGELHMLLQKCDYLINVLPHTPETIGLLAGNTLQNCRGRTVFVNIGRGSIIPETDLIKALRCKWLRGAILDVFEKEPLSLESPLWDMEQVIITPHIAGRPTVKELVALFKDNLTLFQENKSLMYNVDFKIGY